MAALSSPDDAVGTYASRPRPRGHATGSFATGSLTGDPDRPEGSFADVERIVILTYEDDAARSRVTGHRGVRQVLRRAAADNDAVDRAVRDLHDGHAVVLVDGADVAPKRRPGEARAASAGRLRRLPLGETRNDDRNATPSQPCSSVSRRIRAATVDSCRRGASRRPDPHGPA